MLLLVFVVLLVLDVAWVNWRYALDDRPLRLDVPTSDGWTVVAWYRPALKRRFTVPVILCHGLANNHAFMDFRGRQNLAKFLAAAGFECYSVDLRGAGAARAPHEGPCDASVDDYVNFDAPALVDAVCAHAGASQVAWVGHSLGGAVALAGATTSIKGKLAALVTIGSPIFFRFPSSVRWLTRVSSWASVWGQFDPAALRLIAPFAGRVPAPSLARVSANFRNLEPRSQRFLVANVFAPMWKGVLRQLEDWVANDAFRSLDQKVDYRLGLATLTAPILVIGGTVDLLAPPDLTRASFALLTGPVRQLELFGKTHGHSADYGHGDLVVGTQADVEVYPVIARFLEANLTDG